MQSALRVSRVTLPTSLARATHRTMACKDDAVLELINKQLRLYNARDLDAFMEMFSEDVHVSDTVTGAVLARSKAELRPRYEARFSSPVHCELVGRLALGNVVVDREIITGLPDDGVAECMATYLVCPDSMKIKTVQFVWKARTFGVKMH
ncbi:hypothetical protein V8C86DRAFT_2984426 [Haematococcus lacustris]